MAKETKTKTNCKKVTIKADKIVAAYQILSTPANPQAGKAGFKLSALETKDMYIVIRAIGALEPEAQAFEQFRKGASERLIPENWNETMEKYNKFNELSEEEKTEVNKAVINYDNKVNECVMTELDKDKEIDAYEHLSEEAFGLLVKSNGHILNDIPSLRLLREILA